MLTEIHLSPSAIRILVAVVNFGVAVGCIVYIRIAARDMRWSRSNKQLVTRSPQPEMFWFKLVLALLGTLFTLGLGILLLVPISAKSSPWGLPLPKFESTHRR